MRISKPDQICHSYTMPLPTHHAPSHRIPFNYEQQTSGSNYTGIDNFAYSTVALPEPASLSLLGLGAAALLARRRPFAR